jgi:hypothetical protein
MPINIPEKYSEKSDPLNARKTPEIKLNVPITIRNVFID